VDLIVATYRIRFEEQEELILAPDKRFKAFLAMAEGEADVTIRVNKLKFDLPAGAARVFDAPLIEEDNGRVIISGKPFWRVWRDEETTIVEVFPSDGSTEKVLVMNDRSTRWEIYMNSPETRLDPLIYPLDGLILYYLTLQKGAIMVHASAVDYNGRGWLFSGRSGNGKTTIARLFDSQGIVVIHDDRVILVKKEGRWFIHNTPVYQNEVPRSAPLDHIWLIEHGKSNVSVPVEGALATAMILSNCIQQTWEGEATETLLTAIEDVTSMTLVSRLLFVPDAGICNYLILRKEEQKESVFAVALSMLRDGKPVTVAAGGISMWPAIRSDDNVIIEPYFGTELFPGDVVALIRLGGFVVHRIKRTVSRDGRILYMTQGDASAADEHLSEVYEIAGIVKELIRAGSSQLVKPKRMPVFINRITALLEMYMSKM
jgi:hypothetical protein